MLLYVETPLSLGQSDLNTSHFTVTEMSCDPNY